MVIKDIITLIIGTFDLVRTEFRSQLKTCPKQWARVEGVDSCLVPLPYCLQASEDGSVIRHVA